MRDYLHLLNEYVMLSHIGMFAAGFVAFPLLALIGIFVGRHFASAYKQDDYLRDRARHQRF
jgi:hypothetical protein